MLRMNKLLPAPVCPVTKTVKGLKVCWDTLIDFEWSAIEEPLGSVAFTRFIIVFIIYFA